MKLSSLFLSAVAAAPDADLVQTVPGFNSTSFKVYSGLLDVPGPFTMNEYDSLSIHYQIQFSQGDPTKDPLVTWHQGGPGGSSIDVGLYTEMGYFQLSSDGSYTNDFSWNKVANMLYLESPAGSGQRSGFSTCNKKGKAVDCKWNDKSQGEAYAHTLQAFKKAFPEFESNDLFLTGESYFGQYGPNIAHFIVNNKPFDTSLNLKGLALGNACWGGSATNVQCNGPNSDQNDVDMFYGKGLVSKELYEAAYKVCGKGPWRAINPLCDAKIEAVHKAVGPHNVYDIYDNCPNQMEWLNEHGKSSRWLLKHLRAQMNMNAKTVDLDSNSSSTGSDYSEYAEGLALLESSVTKSGGYQWSCGGMDAASDWFGKAENQKAMHLGAPGQSGFGYQSSGPASITLYPELIKKLDILIYNGDSDSCVPYKGNEEWIDGLKEQGLLSEAEAWRPWYADGTAHVPAGYATKYTVKDSEHSFNFVTIRLAGHMVPTFQPQAALSFFTRFLQGKPY